MGFLSFLSRKSSSESHKNLKAQPYNATIASLPPVRGAYPVAGNGPNILETFQKTHPQFNRHHEPPIEFVAPAPIVHRFQNHEEYERPGTAQSQDRKGYSARSRSGSVKVPPVSLLNGAPAKARVELMDPPAKRAAYNMPSIHEPDRVDSPKPPYRLPSKGPGVQESPMKKLPFKLHNNQELDQAIFTTPQPAFAHNRTASIRSGDSAMSGRFVDILDASNAIKPSDFYSRLRAAGARDYGEDVADRNIAENAPTPLIDSGSARAFYAQSSSAPSPIISRGTPDLDGGFEARAKKRFSMGMSLRTKSLSSDSDSQYPARTSSYVPQQPPTPTDDLSRKASTRSKASTIIAQRRKSLPSPVQEHDIDEFPAELHRGITLPSEEHEMTLPMNPVSSNRQASPRNARDSVMLAKNKSPEGSRLMHIENAVTSSPSKKSSRRGTISYTPKVNSTKSRRMSLQGPQDMTEDDGRGRLQTPRMGRDHSRGDLGSTTDPQNCLSSTTLQLNALYSPRVVSSHSQKRRQSWVTPALDQFRRPHSDLSFSGQGIRRLDIEESITERSNSARNWSIDSSATISSMSSNPFRPQSRHTANTSVDFMTDTKASHSSHDSLGSLSYRTAPEIRTQSALSPTEPYRKSKLRRDFNIDDYISSDDDDIDAPRRRLGEGEEELLFQDTGYGFGGMELPGIPGLFDNSSPRPKPPLSPPRSSSRAFSLQEHMLKEPRLRELQLQGRSLSPLSDIDDLPLAGVMSPNTDDVWSHRHSRLSNFTMPNYKSEDHDDDMSSEHEIEDSDEEMSLDIPMTRRSNGPVVRHWNRPRYTSSRQDIIEEERDDKVDVSTAVRMRKDVKRRNRLSGIPVVRHSDKGKESEVTRPQTARDNKYAHQGPMLTWDGRAFSLT